MKYIMLALAILIASGLNSALAETFSCRDSSGALHVADNLMSLPEECLSKAETLDPKDPGKVNYVPATKNPPSTSQDFNRAINEQQRKINARDREAAKMVAKAKELADSYQSGVIQRKSALRNKKYGFRKDVRAASQKMQAAREGKKRLIDEIKRARLSSTQRKQIETSLDKITD